MISLLVISRSNFYELTILLSNDSWTYILENANKIIT